MPPVFRVHLPTGTYDVTPFGIGLSIGILAGWYAALYVARRRRVELGRVSTAYAVAVGAAMIGTVVLWKVPALATFARGRHAPLATAALAIPLGMLGLRDVPWRARADVAIASALAVLGFARVGCHASACHHGRRLASDAPALLRWLGAVHRRVVDDVIVGSDAYLSQLRLGVVRASERHGLPVHPAALYEAVLLLLALLMTLVVASRSPVHGRPALVGGLGAALALGVGWAARAVF